MRSLILGLSMSVVFLSGCGGDSTSAASGSHSLSSGTYSYVADEATTDTCWAPPKTYPELPQTIAADVTVDGADISVSVDPGNTGTPQVFALTRDGNSLTGVSSGSFDLNSQGIDCVLGIQGSFDGTMTADDAFDASQTITISEQSGAYCGLLVGSTEPQVDALPCTLTLAGSATLQ